MRLLVFFCVGGVSRGGVLMFSGFLGKHVLWRILGCVRGIFGVGGEGVDLARDAVIEKRV